MEAIQKRMRLFLAIDLPKGIKEYVFELEKKFKEAKITWVAKKNLHITLKFLGEIDKKELPKIKEQIRVKSTSLDLYLGKMGFFPNAKDPRVIWIGLEPEEKVMELQQKIDEHLLSLFPGEQKFQAHLTVGRIKSIRRKEDFQNSVRSIHIEPKKFQIDSYQLMKSELKKTGPVYEIIENIPLSKM